MFSFLSKLFSSHQATDDIDADENVDNSELLYTTAVSHYSLQQHQQAINLLKQLLSNREVQGLEPKEHWLKLLLANYMSIENSIKAIETQQKITQLNPSEQNEKILSDLTSSS